jgi:hypothetical protein
VFLTKDNSAKLGDFGNIKKIIEKKPYADKPSSTKSEGLERIGEETEHETTEGG